MKTDQFDYTDDDVMLARCVSMLVERLYDKEGNPVDIADKSGREALIRAISDFPREIPTKLSKSDLETLNDTIKECRETQKMVKTWFWWVVGLMFVASSTISLCAVILFKQS